ncbi:MAG: fibronectin-binding protein [Mycobacterium kyogaense]|jgi:hypothetical protein|uniref:fibronectin-binding protein n=1 Tax=Mycobacterium kyogaense TaxID=2212479 RepID=UPI002FFA9DF5
MRVPAVAVVAVAAGVLGAVLSPVAHADPGDGPCEVVMWPLCAVIPSAPSLQGDIDLTTDQPVDPSIPPPDERPPADICANGCM